MPKKLLGDLLVERGALTREEVEVALRVQKRTREKLGQVLLRMGFISSKDLAAGLAAQVGLQFVDLEQTEPHEEAISLLDAEVARRLEVLPLRQEHGMLQVAMKSVYDLGTLDELSRLVGLEIEPVVCEPNKLREMIDFHYRDGVGTFDAIIERAVRTISGEDTLAEAEAAPIITLFETIVANAVQEKTTDIHIEPEEQITRIRFRIDGILRVVSTLPKEVHRPLVARIKILSELDIAENRLPQDGRIQMEVDDQKVDIRVSTYPAERAESVVLRLLMGRAVATTFDSLGLCGSSLGAVEEVIREPYGIILCVGPTGSGKTTTLYSCLTRLATLDRNLMTIEDPIEYRIPLIKQSQVNEKAGFTFARALRAMLRHDPDIILVGEIRDEETSALAFRAAMTGHLVFSTLHANSAAEAFPRLLDLNVDSLSIGSSILAIIGQRLVRKICSHCAEPYEPEPDSALRLLTDEERQTVLQGTLKRGAGCSECHDRGYTGRVGIFEVLRMTKELAGLVSRFKSTLELEEAADFIPMREDGLEKASRGLTTIEEVFRVVR